MPEQTDNQMKNHSDLYRLLGVNLDMALEAYESLPKRDPAQVSGIMIEHENHPYAKVTIVRVLNEMGAEQVGKRPGNYITIDAPEIRFGNREIHQSLSALLAQKIQSLMTIGPKDPVLIVGLGNWHATPDALGPRVIDSTMATRHLFQFAPEELHPGFRPVSALAPGVLGTTGIETAEIVKGVVEKTQPALVICIDSLATTSVERITTSMQLADTGISPGGGVGNRRAGINKETLGIPVIALGIPTVVSSQVIAHHAINALFEEFKTSPGLNQVYQSLNPETMQGIINQVLEPFGGNLMVTPKEIDQLILNTSKIVAGGLAQALHPTIRPDEWTQYLN